MSLRVWLPLNGDLHNQGLSNVNLTNTVTFATSGKIGASCLNSQLGWFTVPEMAGKKQMSFAYWVKLNTGTTTNWLDSFSWYSTNGTSNHRSRQEFYYYNNGGNTEAMTTGVWYYTSSNSGLTQRKIGQWYHYAFTIDYATGITQFFVDGVLWKTTTDADTSYYVKGNNFLLRESSLDCSINDFRLYDHILSELEVKEIARAKILHYPLNNNGWGLDNILINTHFDQRYTQSTGWDTTKNGTQLASSWGGYNSGVANQGTVYHAHLKQVNNEWVYEYIRTANESWLGISQGSLQNKLVAGQTYTFSWEEYHVEGTNRVGTGLYYYKTGATSANFHLGIQQAASITRVIGQWQKYTYTFIAPDDANYSKNMSWYIYGHYNGNGTFYVRKPKLELSSQATLWTPNPSDIIYTNLGINNSLVYDISGYCNNGTKVGTFTYSTDTPKYNLSTVFDGSSSIKFLDFNLGNVWSAGIWFYSPSTSTKTWSSLFAVNNNGGDSDLKMNIFYQQISKSLQYSANGQYQSGIGYPDKDKWHQVFEVFDGTNLYCYLDGSLIRTKSITNSEYIRKNLIIGARSSAIDGGTTTDHFEGKLSDFRIYATALSAQDILSLYHNSAFVDEQGNVYGAIH